MGKDLGAKEIIVLQLLLVLIKHRLLSITLNINGYYLEKTRKTQLKDEGT